MVQAWWWGIPVVVSRNSHGWGGGGGWGGIANNRARVQEKQRLDIYDCVLGHVVATVSREVQRSVCALKLVQKQCVGFTLKCDERKAFNTMQSTPQHSTTQHCKADTILPDPVAPPGSGCPNGRSRPW
jgi:hypothetical protein